MKCVLAMHVAYILDMAVGNELKHLQSFHLCFQQMHQHRLNKYNNNKKSTEKVEELFSCSAFSVVFPHLWFLLSLMCTTTGIKKPALWFSAFYQCAQIITGKKSLIRCRNRSGQTIKFNLYPLHS